jgi:hypothetical protein
MSDRAMDRITAIRKSLATFAWGTVGLLPIIGLIPAVYAIRSWRRVTVQYGNEWNPASAYLSWGARLACLGLLASVLAGFALGLAFISN